MTGHDAIVIGGGFAGATAARELGRGGRRVLLLEARDRLGGRAWYKKEALEGLALEMGGMFVDRRQEHVWREIEHYELPVNEPDMPGTLAWLQQGRLRAGGLPVPPGELSGLERAMQTWVEASRRVDPRVPVSDQGVSDLDVPMPELLEPLGLGPHTRDLLAAVFGEQASADWEESSALNPVQALAAAGNSVTSLFLATSLSPTLVDGTSSLVEAIAEESGAEVRLSEPVRRVVRREARDDAGGRVAVFTDEARYSARVAVVAIPTTVLKDVEFVPRLSEKKRKASAEECAGKGSKVWAVVRDAPEDFFALGHGQKFHLVASEGTAEGGVLMVGFGPDADEVDAGDRAAVEYAFRAYLPHCEVVAAAGHNWKRDPYARRTWTTFRPGQLSRYEKALHEREGRLVFAASDTGVLWPGYIDGAIEGGLRAGAEANRLLAKTPSS